MHARTRSVGLSLVALLALVVVAAACGGRHKGGSPAGTPTPTPTPAPLITSITPSSARPGAIVVVAGSNFGATQGANAVTFGGIAGVASQWSDTSISVAVPPAAALGAGTQPVNVITSSGLSNIVPFVVLMPPAFYVKDGTTPDHVSAYAIDAAGAISPLGGSPYALGGNPQGFSEDSSSLWVNARTRRLYATVNAAVAEYAIDDSAGRLVAVAGSPFPTGTTGNLGVTTNPEGTLVFVSGNGSDSIAVLAVGSSGNLTPVAGSPFTTQVGGGPNGIALAADGKYLYSAQATTQFIERLSVATNGTLMVLGSNAFPAASTYLTLKAHPTTEALYAGGVAIDVPGYGINPGTGDLNALAGSPYSVPSSMSIAIAPDGTRLYVGAFNNGSLAGFDVGANGKLTALSWSPKTLSLPASVVVDVSGDGKFLVSVEQAATSKIHVYALDAAGNPTEVGTGTALDTTNANPEHVAFAR